MTAVDYYNNLSLALGYVNAAIARTQANITDEFDTTNYSDIMNKLMGFRRGIIRMQNIHKYLKMSQAAFIMSSELQENKKIQSIHTVADYETPLSIAQKYNMNLSDLLRKNNILSSDIIAGIELKVELQPTAINQIFSGIPTYGDQSGELVLGQDITNELATGVDLDLSILGPEDTIKQGINNRILTKRGDYPLLPEFGVDIGIGADIPSDLTQGMLIIEIGNMIGEDPRVLSVDNLTGSQKKNAITFSAQITAINNKSLSIN